MDNLLRHLERQEATPLNISKRWNLLVRLREIEICRDIVTKDWLFPCVSYSILSGKKYIISLFNLALVKPSFFPVIQNVFYLKEQEKFTEFNYIVSMDPPFRDLVVYWDDTFTKENVPPFLREMVRPLWDERCTT